MALLDNTAVERVSLVPMLEVGPEDVQVAHIKNYVVQQALTAVDYSSNTRLGSVWFACTAVVYRSTAVAQPPHLQVHFCGSGLLRSSVWCPLLCLPAGGCAVYRRSSSSTAAVSYESVRWEPRFRDV